MMLKRCCFWFSAAVCLLLSSGVAQADRDGTAKLASKRLMNDLQIAVATTAEPSTSRRGPRCALQGGLR